MDYAEYIVEAKSKIIELDQALMNKEYEQAYKLVDDIEVAMNNISVFCDSRIRNTVR